MTPQALGALARAALEAEVALTPKPGLVDQRNSGAHQDMDFPLFLRSAAALAPWFCRFAQMGREGASLPPAALFALLRQPGRQAEQAMLAATGGINTHKGAIFSLGLLCAAGGQLAGGGHGLTSSALCSRVAEMTAGLCSREISEQTGAIARRYGASGARGEAESGFASVRDIALPLLTRYLRGGLSLEESCLRILMHLMAWVDDTNLLARGGREQAQWVRSEAQRLAGCFSVEGLTAFDDQLILRHLSPGGCADLLAVTLFLWAVDAGVSPQRLVGNIPIIR